MKRTVGRRTTRRVTFADDPEPTDPWADEQITLEPAQQKLQLPSKTQQQLSLQATPKAQLLKGGTSMGSACAAEPAASSSQGPSALEKPQQAVAAAAASDDLGPCAQGTVNSNSSTQQPAQQDTAGSLEAGKHQLALAADQQQPVCDSNEDVLDCWEDAL